MGYEGHTFEDEVVLLDDETYTDCTFIDCVINYSGGRTGFYGRTEFRGETVFDFTGKANDILAVASFLMRCTGKSVEDVLGLKPRSSDLMQ